MKRFEFRRPWLWRWFWALAGAARRLAQEHGHDNAAVPDRLDWSFAGPFGKFDQAQLQRGFRVYKEVCSACHQLAIPFRQLV